jgi:ADP-ribose pyrophosphatase
MKIQLKNSSVEYDGFVTIEKDVFQFERFNGEMSQEVMRYRYHRGDAVAVLIFDEAQRRVLLIRQFRNAVHAGTGDGWITECVAGMMEPGETPQDVAFREVLEETGLRLKRADLLSSYYFSPGGCSDRIHLFLGTVENADQPGGVHGLLEEGEEIHAEWVPLETALKMVEEQSIVDGKTLIGLLWLDRQLRRSAGNNSHSLE